MGTWVYGDMGAWGHGGMGTWVVRAVAVRAWDMRHESWDMGPWVMAHGDMGRDHEGCSQRSVGWDGTVQISAHGRVCVGHTGA